MNILVKTVNNITYKEAQEAIEIFKSLNKNPRDIVRVIIVMYWLGVAEGKRIERIRRKARPQVETALTSEASEGAG